MSAHLECLLEAAETVEQMGSARDGHARDALLLAGYAIREDAREAPLRDAADELSVARAYLRLRAADLGVDTRVTADMRGAVRLIIETWLVEIEDGAHRRWHERQQAKKERGT